MEETKPIAISLEPLDDYVVIEPVDEEAETRTGLIIPASAEGQCRSGIVTDRRAGRRRSRAGRQGALPEGLRLRRPARRRRGQGAAPRRPDRPHQRLRRNRCSAVVRIPAPPVSTIVAISGCARFATPPLIPRSGYRHRPGADRCLEKIQDRPRDETRPARRDVGGPHVFARGQAVTMAPHGEVAEWLKAAPC